MHVYMHVCIVYVCVYMHVCGCVYRYIVHICVDGGIHVCEQACVLVHFYMCLFMCVLL